jgi:hypothetical protein
LCARASSSTNRRQWFEMSRTGAGCAIWARRLMKRGRSTMELSELVHTGPGAPDAVTVMAVLAAGTQPSGLGQILAQRTDGRWTQWCPNAVDGSATPRGVLACDGLSSRLVKDGKFQVLVSGWCHPHRLIFPGGCNIELRETGLTLLDRFGLLRPRGSSSAVCGRSPF